MKNLSLRAKLIYFLKNNRKDRHIPSGYTFKGKLSKSATVDDRNASTWYLLPVDPKATDIIAIGLQEGSIHDNYDSFVKVISSPEFVFSKYFEIIDYDPKDETGPGSKPIN